MKKKKEKRLLHEKRCKKCDDSSIMKKYNDDDLYMEKTRYACVPNSRKERNNEAHIRTSEFIHKAAWADSRRL